MWKFTRVSRTRISNPVLIAGLPGIGNVGKIAVDFLVDNLNAKKVYDIFSYSFPNSVFVREDNLVELISISIYHRKVGSKDLLFLVGDVQPTDEFASYEFCEGLLKVLKSMKCSQIVTIGGIGLADVPKSPKVYATANSKKILDFYKKGTKIQKNIYGIVGPIIGVSGLLLGMGKKEGMEAVCLLSETFGHPMYLGVKGAREILIILSKKLGIKIDFDKMDTEIKDMESELLKRVTELEDITKNKSTGDKIRYIG